MNTEMYCKVYNVKINAPFDLPPLSEGFTKGVFSLKGKDSETIAYTRFLDAFGTHFQSGASMGSKYIKTFQSNKEERRKLES